MGKARILLVDDDGPIGSSMRVFFEAVGCEFLAVGSAEKALEEVGRQHYGVIIADYRLPGMDGLEFLRTIRGIYPVLECLERDAKAKKPAKTGAWYCVNCGVSVKRDEAWIEDRGPLCHKHGMRLKIKRVAEALR